MTTHQLFFTIHNARDISQSICECISRVTSLKSTADKIQLTRGQHCILDLYLSNTNTNIRFAIPTWKYIYSTNGWKVASTCWHLFVQELSRLCNILLSVISGNLCYKETNIQLKTEKEKRKVMAHVYQTHWCHDMGLSHQKPHTGRAQYFVHHCYVLESWREVGWEGDVVTIVIFVDNIIPCLFHVNMSNKPWIAIGSGKYINDRKTFLKSLVWEYNGAIFSVRHDYIIQGAL